jgi:hypothetical protein
MPVKPTTAIATISDENRLATQPVRLKKAGDAKMKEREG